jgi:hypothetical protein
MATDFRVTDTLSLVQECLTLDYFYPNDKGEVPIPAKFVPGNGKLVVAVGGNASGKSFFRRIVQGVCAKTKIECIHLSMEGRRTGGIFASFVYGSETHQSTGANSSGTVLTAISTSKARKNKHVIFWDEPDIGLSDDWAASTGAEIRSFIEDAPKPLVGVVLVSHSKALVRELIPLNPHLLSFSETPVGDLTEWLEKPVMIRPLSELKETSYRRFKLIQAVERKNEITSKS